ncbi:MAG: N-acetyltransferase [Acidobacteriota bacterium]
MTGGGLLLRGALAGDIEALTAFEALVFVDEPHRISERQWRDLVRRAPGLTVLALSAADLAGVLVLSSRGRTLRILSLGVHPRFRRQGVGRVLLQQAEAAARSIGLVRIRLEVRADNLGAIALYEAHGYRIEGRLPSYYGEGEDGVRMERVIAVVGDAD